MRGPRALTSARSLAQPLVLLSGLGVFIAALDQTLVVAVLPQMIEDIGLSQDQFYRAAWIVNGYILGYVVAMPFLGRAADAYGHGRVFSVALLVFCLGSALVAISNDLTMLTAARCLQAVGGGAVVPVSLAIVTREASPGHRAIGLGAMAAAAEAGGLLGPLWGGGLSELLGWRGLFWINLPLCLPLAVLTWRMSKPPQQRDAQLDIPGAALLGLSLICLTIALTDDPIERRALAISLGLYGGAFVAFAAFLLRQVRARHPMVDLRLFKRRPVAAGFLINALVGGALIVAMVNVPLFTSAVQNGTALDGGLNLMRLTVGLAIGAVGGGLLSERIGPSKAAMAGLVCAVAGFAGMSQWDENPTFLLMTLPLFVAGLGFGLVIAPVNAVVLDFADETERATVAALLTVIRLVGALVGVALLTTRGLSGFYAAAGEVDITTPQYIDIVRALEVDSFRHGFIVTAIVCFVALIPAAALRLRRKDEVAVTPVVEDNNG
jgi:EmrB/QacA subfamily drug resistance transporter